MKSRAEELLNRYSQLPSQLAPFSEHVREVIEYAISRLNLARSVERPITRDLLILTAYQLLELLSYHGSYVELAKEQMRNRTWDALRNMLLFFSSRTGLSGSIIPVLADGYYALGKPVYFKRFRRMIPVNPFYIISVDSTDLPIFWPLSVHELAHCLLSETRHLEEALAHITAQFELGREMRELLERRTEELLCDIIAVRLCGPAYLDAFVYSLWPILSVRPSNEYPLHSLRLKCMALTLEEAGIYNYTEYINEIINSRVGFRGRDGLDELDEVLESVKGFLIDITRNIPTLVNARIYERVKEVEDLTAITSERITPPEIFNASWIMVKNTAPDRFIMKARDITPVIYESLICALGR